MADGTVTKIDPLEDDPFFGPNAPQLTIDQVPLPKFPFNGNGRVVSGDDPSRFAMTDAGNAELLASMYGDRWRYDHSRGRDLLYDGQRWRQDLTDEPVLLAIAAARYRFTRCILIPGMDEREKASRWAIRSESRERIQAALALARAHQPVSDRGDSWDKKPMLLAVGNGVVDLERGILRNGGAEDRLTLHTPVPYAPQSRCPQFERFLVDVFAGDAELIDFVHRAIGYSITGLTIQQVLFILFGTGANGKSVLLSILRAVLGEYAYNMPFSAIELKDRAAIPNDVAAIADRRFVSAAETNDGTRLNEARIKALTGCDPITARFLHHEFFTFTPVAKFWLSVNHKPRVSDDSYGFWRRVRIVPFLRQFAGDEADPFIEQKLRAELPGILAFAVRGCLEYQRRGLQAPSCVTTATDEYRRESDPLGQFITECVRTPGGGVYAADLYKRYVGWAESQGFQNREIMTAQGFGRRISGRLTKTQDRRGTLYEGIAI